MDDLLLKDLVKGERGGVKNNAMNEISLKEKVEGRRETEKSAAPDEISLKARIEDWAWPAATLLIFLAVWEAVCRLGFVATYMLAPTYAIVLRLLMTGLFVRVDEW